MVATLAFRSMGIPCSLYIDDRHNGALLVDLERGAYAQFPRQDEKNLAAARSSIYLVCYFLISLGYFLGLSKSILEPSKVVPYLGFLCDSEPQVFNLIPAKKEKFLNLVECILRGSTVSE